jgi:hypothetical protein
VKTYSAVKFALLPLAIFLFLAAYGWPTIAVATGLVISISVALWRFYSGEIKNLELAVVVLFCALAVGVFFLGDVVPAHAISLAFGGLAAYALASVILARPWSTEFSRAAYPEAVGDPIFFRINMIMSALWAALFMLVAITEEMTGSRVLRFAIIGLGAVVTIFGPELLRRKLSARNG